MLARFKWLIAAAGFLIQYMVLPMLPGGSVYPDVALAAVCALGLIYGPLRGRAGWVAVYAVAGAHRAYVCAAGAGVRVYEL